jgi:hypothetical protein
MRFHHPLSVGINVFNSLMIAKKISQNTIRREIIGLLKNKFISFQLSFFSPFSPCYFSNKLGVSGLKWSNIHATSNNKIGDD